MGLFRRASSRVAGSPGIVNSLRLPLLCLALFSPGFAWADWAGLSGYSALAELSIEPGQVALNLRMKVADLPHLAELADLPPGAASAPEIARRLIRLQDASGKALALALPGTTTASTEAELGESGPPPLEVNLEFPLRELPQTLEVMPPAGIRGEIGLVVLHRGVPLADLAVLRHPLSIHLDPGDPWQSRLDDPALRRRHAQPRSFLYVEPQGVRHEILVRLAALQRRLHFPLKNTEVVAEDERSALAAASSALLREKTQLLINGEGSAPRQEQVRFVRFTRSGVQPLPPGDISVPAALVGIIQAYPTAVAAETLRLSWDLFEDSGAEWPVTVIDGRESFDTYVTPEPGSVEWSKDDSFTPADDPPQAGRLGEVAAALPDMTGNAGAASPLWLLPSACLALLLLTAWLLWRLRPRSPVGGIALTLALTVAGCMAFYPPLRPVGQARPVARDDGRIRQALVPLLYNAYQAMQLRGEEAVYDALALSLDGALLEETYLLQRRAMQRRDTGLAGEGQVDRIEIRRAEIQGRETAANTYEVTAEWVAHGSVSHWGHSHPRHNRYRARLIVTTGAERGFRIIAMDFLDGQTLANTAPS